MMNKRKLDNAMNESSVEQHVRKSDVIVYIV